MMIDIKKARTYSGKVYTNFCSLNVPEDGVECEFFTFLLIHYCLQKKILPSSIVRQLCF